MNTEKLVVIVGAGPSGTVAAALLKKTVITSSSLKNKTFLVSLSVRVYYVVA